MHSDEFNPRRVKKQKTDSDPRDGLPELHMIFPLGPGTLCDGCWHGMQKAVISV